MICMCLALAMTARGRIQQPVYQRTDSITICRLLENGPDAALWEAEPRTGRPHQIRAHLAGRNLVFRWSIYLFLFFFVILCGKYGPGYNAASFIYMGF